MNEEQQKQLDKLARDVLILSRNTLLVNLRFLDSALSQFKFLAYDGSLATEGRHICYNPIEILKRYKNEKEASVREYLHLVMHCIFRQDQFRLLQVLLLLLLLRQLLLHKKYLTM